MALKPKNIGPPRLIGTQPEGTLPPYHPNFKERQNKIGCHDVMLPNQNLLSTWGYM